MNDLNQIQVYRKVVYPSGAVRYVEAEKIYDYELIEKGVTYLVRKETGVSIKVIREPVMPDWRKVLVALDLVKDEAIEILREANKIKSDNTHTPLEKKAWEKYCEVMGENRPISFRGISMDNFIDKLINLIKQNIRD